MELSNPQGSRNKVFVSNNGNYILDCAFGSIEDPRALHNELKLLLGVVETGLFIKRPKPNSSRFRSFLRRRLHLHMQI